MLSNGKGLVRNPGRQKTSPAHGIEQLSNRPPSIYVDFVASTTCNLSCFIDIGQSEKILVRAGIKSGRALL